MKKSLSWLFLLAILLVSIVSIGPNIVSVQAKSEKVITVWCWDPSFNIYAMEEAAKIYAQKAPNVKINVVETPWDDVQTKITAAVVSGQTSTLPDIVLVQDNALAKNVINYPGTFVDLTNSKIDFTKFAEFKVALSKINNRNYAVPFDNGTAINALRSDVLAEAGYKVEDFTDITWAEFIKLGKDVLKKTGKPLLSSVAESPDLLMIMLQSAGSWLFDEKGRVYIAKNNVLKEVIEVYIELVKSGVMVQVNDWEQYISSFSTSTVAGTINGCWIIGSITAQPQQKGLWRVTNIPKLMKTANASNYSNQGGSSWMVLASSKNKKVAIDFLTHTFAESVELYETILPSSGALATYLPAGDSDVYNQPHEFFGGQAIYAEITEYAAKVPQVKYGVYNYEAREAVGTAITRILSGANIDSALREAEETVKFLMGP